jgi:SpoIID/LytB domain protein
MEALKAQAVAARSYAYGAAASGSTLWCTTMSQVYNGADDGASSHESPYTDAAVAATAGQCVVYGSTVVQTFFSSNCGGHTANIEDVWPGSTPEPYYTGVTSGEPASSPNYRWSLADMSGTTMAGKIRSYSSSLAQPSPATVTTVTLAPAVSGFVLHITLKWSNGKSTTLTGGQFKSALGLKSTAFDVVLKNPPAVATILTLHGGVTSVTAGVPFTLRGTIAPVHACSVALQCKSPGSSSWAALRSVTTSSDGTFAASVTAQAGGTFRYRAAYAGATAWRASTSATVSVVVTVVKPPVWKRYEQNATSVTYHGAWRTSALVGLSGATHAYSHDTSATAVFTFTGTQARWIGKRAASYGKAWVSVDASAPVLVDLYSAKTLNQQRLFQSAALALGVHRLTVRVAGTKNAKATYDYVDVDAFEALQSVK